ncbi:Rac-like GTP-binding protein 2, partial [Hondaea fermentalgiana]
WAAASSWSSARAPPARRPWCARCWAYRPWRSTSRRWASSSSAPMQSRGGKRNSTADLNARRTAWRRCAWPCKRSDPEARRGNRCPGASPKAFQMSSLGADVLLPRGLSRQRCRWNWCPRPRWRDDSTWRRSGTWPARRSRARRSSLRSGTMRARTSFTRCTTFSSRARAASSWSSSTCRNSSPRKTKPWSTFPFGSTRSSCMRQLHPSFSWARTM